MTLLFIFLFIPSDLIESNIPTYKYIIQRSFQFPLVVPKSLSFHKEFRSQYVMGRVNFVATIPYR